MKFTSTRNKVDAPPSVPLLRLAKQQKFDEILEHLQNDTHELEPWLNPSSNSSGSRGRYGSGSARHLQTSLRSLHGSGTSLHLIMAYRPPTPVVDLLICHMRKLDPTVVPEEAVDAEGKTPLHLAAASGCHVGVVSRLLYGVSAVMPAIVKDSCKRYPLHWACANLRTNIKTFKKKTEFAAENMILVITELVKAYPMAAAVMDKYGYTPLDLAKQNKADMRIIVLLTHLVQLHGPSHGTGTMSVTEASPSEDDVESPTGLAELLLNMNNDKHNTSDEVSSIGSGGVSMLQHRF